MNFIVDNKFAIFLSFMIFYCLFNYRLQEGYDNKTLKQNIKTKEVTVANEEDKKAANKARENAETIRNELKPQTDEIMENQDVEKSAEAELDRDRDIALEKAGTKQEQEAKIKKALSESRKVEAIDGKKGQEMEQKAAEDMKKLLNKGSPEPETNARLSHSAAKQQKNDADTEMAKKAAQAAKDLASTAMSSTMRDVAKAQDVAIENLRASVTSSKKTEKKIGEIASSFGLSSQKYGGLSGQGSQVAKNSKEQRDRLAAQLSCEERCKYLYDKDTGFLCDSGNCICKILKHKKHLLKLPREYNKNYNNNFEGFTSKKMSKYIYRTHGKCDSDEMNTGDA